MKRLALISLVFIASASVASAETDHEIVERVRASIHKIFVDQASWALPDYFWNNDLAESDKEKIVQELAKGSAGCFVDAIVAYAEQTKIPLSQLVRDNNTVSFKGGEASDFLQLYEPCILTVWEAAGVGDAVGLTQ